MKDNRLSKTESALIRYLEWDIENNRANNQVYLDILGMIFGSSATPAVVGAPLNPTVRRKAAYTYMRYITYNMAAAAASDKHRVIPSITEDLFNRIQGEYRALRTGTYEREPFVTLDSNGGIDFANSDKAMVAFFIDKLLHRGNRYDNFDFKKAFSDMAKKEAQDITDTMVRLNFMSNPSVDPRGYEFCRFVPKSEDLSDPKVCEALRTLCRGILYNRENKKDYDSYMSGFRTGPRIIFATGVTLAGAVAVGTALYMTVPPVKSAFDDAATKIANGLNSMFKPVNNQTSNTEEGNSGAVIDGGASGDNQSETPTITWGSKYADKDVYAVVDSDAQAAANNALAEAVESEGVGLKNIADMVIVKEPGNANYSILFKVNGNDSIKDNIYKVSNCMPIYDVESIKNASSDESLGNGINSADEKASADSCVSSIVAAINNGAITNIYSTTQSVSEYIDDQNEEHSLFRPYKSPVTPCDVIVDGLHGESIAIAANVQDNDRTMINNICAQYMGAGTQFEAMSMDEDGSFNIYGLSGGKFCRVHFDCGIEGDTSYIKEVDGSKYLNTSDVICIFKISNAVPQLGEDGKYVIEEKDSIEDFGDDSVFTLKDVSSVIQEGCVYFSNNEEGNKKYNMLMGDYPQVSVVELETSGQEPSSPVDESATAETQAQDSATDISEQ